MSEYDALEAQLGYRFQDLQLLRLALSHPSVAQEQGIKLGNNQRLEFLGDSVLGLILTEELYRRFPGVEEGSLTQARARMVNGRFLAQQARRLGIPPYLILSRGEDHSGGRERHSNLANALEAIMGAMYMDGGLAAAREFVLRVFGPELEREPPGSGSDNPKGRLQERLQVDASPPPVYQLMAASGPDHDRRYECAVYHLRRELARGTGRSKKEAETAAALAALARLEQGAEAAPPLQGQAGGAGA